MDSENIHKALQGIQNLIDADRSQIRKHDGYIGGDNGLVRLSDEQAEIAIRFGIPIGMCSIHDDYHGSHKGQYSYDHVDSMDAVNRCRSQRMYENRPSISPYLPDPRKMLGYIEQIADLEQAAREGRQTPETALLSEKLYSPVFCEIVPNDNWGYDDDIADYRDGPLAQSEAAYYLDAIHEAILIERTPDEEPRGLMTYYHEDDSLNGKVHSLDVDVEVHDGRLWGVAALTLTETLTPEELAKLKDYLTGQYSDGFGEGFEQREVSVDDGKIAVHLWDSGDEFFIATEREFRQRLGLETPAQAALHEPDIYDDKPTADLREQLIQRLDGNLSEYFEREVNPEKNSIPGMSSEIAAVTGAHYYLTEIHNFHQSELEYLLQFKNPLEVVADAFQAAGMDDYSDVMWNVFDNQDALDGGYDRMPDVAGEEARKQELFHRLDQNLSDYREGLMGADKEELIGMAGEIAAQYAVRDYLKSGYDFQPGEVDYLLQFKHPLALVANQWPDTLEGLAPMDGVVHDILTNRDAHANYLAANARTEPAAQQRQPGRSSVLEQIRQAREEAKNNPAPHKDAPGKDRGPEL